MMSSPQLSPPSIPNWYRAQEVATLLGVSTMTIFREIHRGEMKATRVGRLVRIKPEDLTEYLRRKEIKVTSSPDAPAS